MEKITGNIVEGVVIDTMGIDGRKKSILASYLGRYHTRTVKIIITRKTVFFISISLYLRRLFLGIPPSM